LPYPSLVLVNGAIRTMVELIDLVAACDGSVVGPVTELEIDAALAKLAAAVAEIHVNQAHERGALADYIATEYAS
jgi:hypothetical protein